MEDDVPDDYGEGPVANFGELNGSEAPPLPEWAVPVKRTDEVGLLAWQVAGEPGGMPDFTAVPALIDALHEAGMHQWAARVNEMVVQALRQVHLMARDPRRVREYLRELGIGTRNKVSPLLYDLNSVCTVLDAGTRFERPPQKVEVVQVLPHGGGTVVRAECGYCHRGERVTLDDGRRGFAVTSTDESGMTQILLEAGGSV